MAPYMKVWRLGKRRFLQNEARLWIISNRKLEVMMFGGGISAVLLYNFYPNAFDTLIGILIFVLGVLAWYSVQSLYERDKIYEGYRDGYEAGYIDGHGKVKMKRLREEETREDLDRGIEKARGYIFNRNTIYDKSYWE